MRWWETDTDEGRRHREDVKCIQREGEGDRWKEKETMDGTEIE